MAEQKSRIVSSQQKVRARRMFDAVLRTSQLRSLASSPNAVDHHWVSEALQEIDTAHEELQNAEEELQSQIDDLIDARRTLELEARAYRELFDNAPDAYLVTNRDGVIQRANQRARQLFNVELAYLINKPLVVFTSESDRRVLRDMLSLLYSAAEPTTFELTVSRGGQQPVATVARVQRVGADPSCASLHWSIREQRTADARQEAKVRAELERVSNELEHEREQRAQAEGKVAARNRRLAFVSHELRNPLLCLGGWLEVLAHDGADPKARAEIVGFLNDTTQVLTNLVQELLDQTRLDEALFCLRRREVDLRKLLERLCEDTRVVLAQHKALDLRAAIDPELGSFPCDPQRFRQVVVNLLDNAAKCTPAGGRVELRAVRNASGLELSVSDSGRGIAADKLNQIFEPFMRVEGHDTGTGLGLGLNIAQRLVELHGGTIVAESPGLGLGATFRVRLPG